MRRHQLLQVKNTVGAAALHNDVPYLNDRVQSGQVARESACRPWSDGPCPSDAVIVTPRRSRKWKFRRPCWSDVSFCRASRCFKDLFTTRCTLSQTSRPGIYSASWRRRKYHDARQYKFVHGQRRAPCRHEHTAYTRTTVSPMLQIAQLLTAASGPHSRTSCGCCCSARKEPFPTFLQLT